MTPVRATAPRPPAARSELDYHSGLVRVLLVVLGGALAATSGATTAIVLYELAVHGLSWELPALVLGLLMVVLFVGLALAGVGLLLRGARGRPRAEAE